MDYQLLLFDLDFTLLRSDKTISSYTLSVLKRCREKGILIGFSTSRGNTNIGQLINQVGPDLVICNAGASIYYHNNLIKTVSFSLEESQKIFDRAYSFCGPKVEITCDTLNTLYWNRREDKTEQYGPDAPFDDFKDFKQEVLKICVQTNDEEVAKKLAYGIENCVCMPFSDIPWYKFSPKLATKENAISFLSQYLKIPVEKMAAFGDDFSDIGMLKLCGTGIAVGNAIPQVKEIADFVCDSCDQDGPAAWIEKNLFI